MNTNEGGKNELTPMRQRAESRLASKHFKIAQPRTPLETEKLVHELEVHQIELEMQAEELLENRSVIESLLSEYTEIYDFAPVGYFTLSSDGLVKRVNLSGSRFIGMDRSSLVGRDFSLLLSVEQRGLFRAFLQKARESDKSICADWAFSPRANTLGYARVNASFDGHSEEIRITVDDITDRVESQKALALSNAALSAAANTIVITDQDGIVQWVNLAFTTMTGYSSSEVIGKKVSVLKSGRQSDLFYQKLLATISAKNVWQGEIINRRKDGTVYTEQMTITPIVDDLQSITHYIAVKEDISIRKADEEALVQLSHDLENLVSERTLQLQQALDAARQASKAKTEFLSRASHELRTPMNAILGFAQLLDMKFDDAQTKDLVGMILSGGHHLMTLINQLLDLSRIESGPGSQTLETVAIQDVVEESVRLIGPIAKAARVTVTVEGSISDCPSIQANRLWLRQVLLNLLSNSVKYNVADGSVTIRITEVDGHRIRLEILDTGMGIAQEDQANLFMPFQRLGHQEIEGSGLGLVLCKQYVELMGGRIGLLHSSPNGSTFYLDLVRSETHVVNRVPTPGHVVASSESEEHITVLYIEDDLTNFRLVQVAFERFTSHNLIHSIQGNVGIAIAIREQPDLILLDNRLPDMSGHEVLLQLKANPLTQCIPVIVLSADVSEEKTLDMMAAGASHYLTKPINLEQLFESIKVTVAKAQHKVQLA